MTEQQANEMLHWLQVIARDISSILESIQQQPCTRCSGTGIIDSDVTYGDGVMAIERPCSDCEGRGRV